MTAAQVHELRMLVLKWQARAARPETTNLRASVLLDCANELQQVIREISVHERSMEQFNELRDQAIGNALRE